MPPRKIMSAPDGACCARAGPGCMPSPVAPAAAAGQRHEVSARGLLTQLSRRNRTRPTGVKILVGEESSHTEAAHDERVSNCRVAVGSSEPHRHVSASPSGPEFACAPRPEPIGPECCALGMKKSSIPVGLAAGPDVTALTAERRLTAVCRHKGHSDELSEARRSIPLADVCRTSVGDALHVVDEVRC